MNKRAIILAGGKGSRLRPFSITFPKPLMPLGDTPILEIVIRQLIHYGFDHITLSVNHLAELLETFFGNGKKWGIKIDYTFEEIPMGTMGPLKRIRDLPDNFLVMNGDVLSDLNFNSFYNFHQDNNNLFTISCCKKNISSELGIIEYDSTGKLTNFKEKPVLSFSVSMGIYMAHKEITDYIPPNQFYGFDRLMIDLLKLKKNVSVMPFEGYWRDIGRFEDYNMASEEFEEYKKVLLK
ncbi:MAG: NTP transferase domain-containing protein [Oligoflexia bacterium]|nr:NTP transferase domain-containing protein [Oligoflexia bacterium]